MVALVNESTSRGSLTDNPSEQNVRFPPRKVPPTPAQGEKQSSPPSNVVPRSPLSPMTPTSPLYPDGLIAPIWVRKHSEMIPAVFVLFMRLFESSTPMSPLEGKDDSAKEEERRHDAELATEIGVRKKSCTDRGIKLTVVLLASRKMLGGCLYLLDCSTVEVIPVVLNPLQMI